MTGRSLLSALLVVTLLACVPAVALAQGDVFSSRGAPPPQRAPMPPPGPGNTMAPGNLPIPPECMPNLADIFTAHDLVGDLGRCLARTLPAGARVDEGMIQIPSVLSNALQVAQIIFRFYQTRHPIGIVRVRAQSMQGPTWNQAVPGPINDAFPLCLMLLSGTEPTVWDQATTLPEDMLAALNRAGDDQFQQAILRALDIAVRKNYCDAGAQLIIGGHSLGGMEAQNVAYALARGGGRMRVVNIVTYGSPLTAMLPPTVSIRRFSAIGDPIPYSTCATATFRFAPQTIVSDLTGPARTAAIAQANMQRDQALAWSVNMPMPTATGTPMACMYALGPWLAMGATSAHMSYPETMELSRYDVVGNPIGAGVGLRLHVETFAARDGSGTVMHTFGAQRGPVQGSW